MAGGCSRRITGSKRTWYISPTVQASAIANCTGMSLRWKWPQLHGVLLVAQWLLRPPLRAAWLSCHPLSPATLQIYELWWKIERKTEKVILHALCGIQKAPTLVIKIPRKKKVGIRNRRIDHLLPNRSITKICLNIRITETSYTGHRAQIMVKTSVFCASRQREISWRRGAYLAWREWHAQCQQWSQLELVPQVEESSQQRPWWA